MNDNTPPPDAAMRAAAKLGFQNAKAKLAAATIIATEYAPLIAQMEKIRKYVDSYRQALDRYGPNCRFEGEGQISASVIEDLEEILTKHRPAQGPKADNGAEGER